MADPPATELVDRWIEAWTHLRSLTSTTVDGWRLVHVGSATRETELICVDPGPAAFNGLMHHAAGDPRAMLTVIAADRGPYTALELPPTVRIDRDDETLMSTALQPINAPLVGPGLTARMEVEDNVIRYTVESEERVAAEGTIGVLGTVAVLDAIDTTPAFRRCGLARHVVANLTTYALAHGATEGILAATAHGRALYESLGWQVRLEMLSLMGVASP